MKLTGNFPLNRYLWAKQQVQLLLMQQPGAFYYDIGAGDNALQQSVGHLPSRTRSFDLYPQNDKIEQWDIEQPLPNSYPPADIVTFLEVVEHLNNPWLCVKNVSALIAPGGYLLLTTPNPGWSSSRINLLLKGFLTCFNQSDLDLNHHVFTAWPH